MTGATRRRWTRRILFGVAALAVLAVGASWAFIRLQPTLPPLALPTAAASAPVGPLDGTWALSAGSVAEVAGTIRVAFTAWDIRGPPGTASSAPSPITGWRSSC
jgi:hypothetical protein